MGLCYRVSFVVKVPRQYLRYMTVVGRINKFSNWELKWYFTDKTVKTVTKSCKKSGHFPVKQTHTPHLPATKKVTHNDVIRYDVINKKKHPIPISTIKKKYYLFVPLPFKFIISPRKRTKKRVIIILIIFVFFFSEKGQNSSSRKFFIVADVPI